MKVDKMTWELALSRESELKRLIGIAIEKRNSVAIKTQYHRSQIKLLRGSHNDYLDKQLNYESELNHLYANHPVFQEKEKK